LTKFIATIGDEAITNYTRELESTAAETVP